MTRIRNVYWSDEDRKRSFDEVWDVVVVGSGGGALVAAITAADAGASVLVVEKDDVVGGTTGVSGGAMWIPNNSHVGEVDESDSREDALAYLRHLSAGDAPDASLVEAFVDAAPKMLDFLESNTPLEMRAIANFPDYYHGVADVPGTKSSGRTVEPVPYAVRSEIPHWADRIAVRAAMLSLGARRTLAEERARQSSGEQLSDEVQREVDDVRVKGAALVGRLLKGLLDRNVAIRTGSAACGLIIDHDEVVGLRVADGDSERLIGAGRGVVLACGGYEWNAELVRAFIGYDVKPVSPQSNTGDGLVMLMTAGAALANMRSYWGTGVSYDTELTHDGEPVAQFGSPVRGKPNSLIVNGHGRRFRNEAVPYNDFPKSFGDADPQRPGYANAVPAWLIFDRRTRQEARIITVGPDDPDPEWLHASATIPELAGRIGIDAEALAGTVDRFNRDASDGVDEFGRQAIGPVDCPPYYAMEVHPGTLGTNGGARINANAQVLGHDGSVIEGLYAAGNTAAGVFGFLYPSGGGPIGISCTFGYLAGRHVASRADRSL